MHTRKTLYLFSLFRQLRLSRQTMAALLLSILMSLMIVLLIRFSQSLNPLATPELTIRTVELAVPPPPPPPPPIQQHVIQHSTLQLDLNAGTAATALDIQMPKESLVLPAPTLPSLQQAQQLNWTQDLSVNWSALSLDELDKLPQLLAVDNPVFPQALARRNIKSVVVRLDIMINEAGLVRLIKVSDNPYPALLDSAIRSLARSARFSVPMQNGKAVRTRFIWPVELTQ